MPSVNSSPTNSVLHLILNKFIYIVLAAFVLIGCQEQRISDDPTLYLSFSKDTISFDTVFTNLGSTTQRVLIYNRNANALRITRMWQDLSSSPFYPNLDGENQLTNITDLVIEGHDSAYLFVKVNIDPTKQNNPVLFEDNLHFMVNGNTQTIHLEAIGQDVYLIKSDKRYTIYDRKGFVANKPYLIYDTVVVTGRLTLQPGARLYFHNNAGLYALGSVKAEGTLDQPIQLQGDRIDRLFENVPYAYVSGMWTGFFLLPDSSQASSCTYDLNHVEVRSANVGLWAYNSPMANKPTLHLTNSLIHNHSRYGLVLQNFDAEVTNTEISNTASYLVYLQGGKHRFIHNTIASYFNHTNVRIQSVRREDVPAVYIDSTEAHGATQVTFINCIVDGVRTNNVEMDSTSTPSTYDIHGNYLKADSIAEASHNIYWQKTDTLPVFVNNYYKYLEYNYYDFRLDSLSPARGIGDSLVLLEDVRYQRDRLGNERPLNQRPDAGCYQYQPGSAAAERLRSRTFSLPVHDVLTAPRWFDHIGHLYNPIDIPPPSHGHCLWSG